MFLNTAAFNNLGIEDPQEKLNIPVIEVINAIPQGIEISFILSGRHPLKMKVMSMYDHGHLLMQQIKKRGFIFLMKVFKFSKHVFQAFVFQFLQSPCNDCYF